MRIVVTGTPGSGKTILAKALGEKLDYKVINEKDFALKNSLGIFNEENELEIPIKKFQSKANAFLKKNDDVIIEGHVVCEMKLNVDKVILIRVHPEVLESRLEQRNYAPQKMMDNVFCEGIEYCKKQAVKNYSKKAIIEIESRPSFKQTLSEALNALKTAKNPKTRTF
ncbi:MAG: AAA family ATPase [archaeon]